MKIKLYSYHEVEVALPAYFILETESCIMSMQILTEKSANIIVYWKKTQTVSVHWETAPDSDIMQGDIVDYNRWLFELRRADAFISEQIDLLIENHCTPEEEEEPVDEPCYNEDPDIYYKKKKEAEI